MTYRVAITEQRSPQAEPIVVLYAGLSYEEAFQAAVKARDVQEYRHKWIKLEDGDLGVTKWAQVL